MKRARSWLLTLTAAAALLAAAPWGGSQPPADKSPVPDAATQARAEALVKKLYGSEFADAKNDPAAALALASTLLRESQATKDDPVLRFAALGQARDLAAQAGDAPTLLQAVEELVKHYPVKGLGMKSAGLATAAGRATAREANQAIVEAALGLLDEALFEDDYGAARILLDAAETAAARLKNLALYGKVDKRAQEVEAARKQFAQVQKFADRLAQDDADPEANYQLGRYTCLIKGNWERGLPLLARGKDAAWKALAERQLARPTDPSAQAHLGDACTRLADGEKGQAQRNLRRRALHWYTAALPRLEGLTRVRVQRELQELAKRFPSSLRVGEIVAEILRINSTHLGGVSMATVSADGKRILSGGYQDKTVRLWDAKTGKELRQFVGHTGNIQCVAFSPDGKYAASGCTNKQLRLWDVHSGAEVRQFFGNNDFLRGLHFLPDGKRLVSVCDDRTLRVWDLATGNQLQNLTVHTKYINALSVSKDGTRAVTAGEDMTVAVWDLVSLKEIRRFTHTGSVWAAAISPDGKRVLSSGFDRKVRLWDVDAGKQLRELPHPSMVWAIAFTPDGKRVLTASGQQNDQLKKGEALKGVGPAPSTDTYVRIWDVDAGKELRKLEGHTGLVRTVTLPADGRLAVTSSNDNTIRVWGERK